VAGLLVALHGPLVFYDGELLPTSLCTFLAAAAVWLSTRDRPTWLTALLSGLAVGLGAIAFAPVLLLLPVVAWACASGRSLRPLICLAATAAVIAPVTLTNRVRSGEWILISANGGVNLWIGNNPNIDYAMALRPGAGWEELVAEPERLGILTAGGQDSYFTQKALSFCAEHPLPCLRNIGYKARLLFVSRDLPRNEDLYVVREQSPVLFALTARVGSVALPYALLWPLAAAGIAAALLQREQRARILVVAALALAAPCIVFFVTGRYRAPLAPVLSMLSAIGAAELLAPRVKPSWAPLALGLGALSLSVWPVRLMVDRVNFRAELEYAAGGRQARLGDDEGAVGAWRRALAIRPDYLEAGYNLGLALERLGRHREAAEAYGAVLARHPSSLEARLRRANALLTAGDLAAAQSAFQALLQQIPGSGEALLGLARTALARGEDASADALAAQAEQALGGSDPRAAEIRRQVAARGP
jgi:tetratricopeptide (TPR) repeat protein